MKPKLIAEEGLLKGLVIALEDKESWTIGRDPESCSVVLEDPSVSRQHLRISREDDTYFIENLSLINPILVNRQALQDKTVLKDGSIIQIGSSWFRYTLSFDEAHTFDDKDVEGTELETIFEEKDQSPTIVDLSFPTSRWLLKVIAGPNTGGEFFMQANKTYIVGKDPQVSDIVFHDRSVSAEHASITIGDDEKIEIRDLNSKNGVFVSAEQIDEKKELTANEVIDMGTTSFVILDTKSPSETLISPKIRVAAPKEVKEEEKEALAAPKKKKRVFVPLQDLFIVGFMATILLTITFAGIMLFKKPKIEIDKIDYRHQIAKAIDPYKTIEFTFNPGSGDLLLVGNISTSVEKDGLFFNLKLLPFIQKIDDKVIIDRLVWQEMNSILAKHPSWKSISMHSPSPSFFVVTGYLQNQEQWSELQDYLNSHFAYLDRLENRVIIEQVMQQEINKLIMEHGFGNIETSYGEGEVTFAGSASDRSSVTFQHLLRQISSLEGVRRINNLVVFQRRTEEAIDISQQYQISGTTKRESRSSYVVINGTIYAIGDFIDGMEIEKILINRVLLEKDGLKYRINYNL